MQSRYGLSHTQNTDQKSKKYDFAKLNEKRMTTKLSNPILNKTLS